MPDRPSTVVAYAAGASLAAIAAFYVFGPTFFIDGDNAYNTSDGRKRTIIGLSNPANDCFINSVLQALAGLGDLRLYLIRELHRRQLDGLEVYQSPPDVLKKGERADKIISLQQGPVTKALKDMLDALNERPIYKKTISARPMIEALERAFQTRISRNQQDAQEFLQIVLERLCDEYHAGERARKRVLGEKDSTLNIRDIGEANGDLPGSYTRTIARIGSKEGFPFEGRIESQIQCQHCGFRTKPSATTFVSLTLNVPQKSSTSLDSCFDILLKSEEIDGYKCDKCRLMHALEGKKIQLRTAKSENDQARLQREISLLEKSIVEDPEKPPEDVELPDSKQAPKRKIKKSTRITVFPKVIAIHLSRSVYEANSYSTKNLAKVSYTQRLRLGGLLNEKWYKLLGVVCHKGSHNSGHYESFRRNHVYPPFATPDAFSAYAAVSRNTSTATSVNPSPSINAVQLPNEGSPSTLKSGASLSTTSLSNGNNQPPTQDSDPRSESVSTEKVDTVGQNLLSVQRTWTQTSKPQISSHKTAKSRQRKKSTDRWWRISDEKIKETRISDVLSMQREVYLLFYELERPGEDALA